MITYRGRSAVRDMARPGGVLPGSAGCLKQTGQPLDPRWRFPDLDGIPDRVVDPGDADQESAAAWESGGMVICDRPIADVPGGMGDGRPQWMQYATIALHRFGEVRSLGLACRAAPRHRLHCRASQHRGGPALDLASIRRCRRCSGPRRYLRWSQRPDGDAAPGRFRSSTTRWRRR